jgi:hypothetical protein
MIRLDFKHVCTLGYIARVHRPDAHRDVAACRVQSQGSIDWHAGAFALVGLQAGLAALNFRGVSKTEEVQQGDKASD